MSVKKIKNFIFSLSAIVIFFLMLEGIFRIFSLPASYDFIEKSIIEQGMKPKKAQGEYRILMYGESTMHGNHLFPKSTIAKWLNLYLENLLGEEYAKKITVINLGRLGEDSKFISNAFFDTIVYKPDLVVFYTAHNDFIQLENRKKFLSERNTWKSKIPDKFFSIIKKSSFVSFVRRLAVVRKIKRNGLKDKLKDKEDKWYEHIDRKQYDPEIDLLEPNGKGFELIRLNWQRNVSAIIKKAQQYNIPVVFFEGVHRDKDYPPFYPVHDKNLTDEQLESLTKLSGDAESDFESGNYAGAVETYGKCLKIDSEYALTYFRMARCYEKLRLFNEAKQMYIIANDKDYFPVRAPSCVNNFYEQLRASNIKNVYIIQTRDIFERNSSGGIIDKNLILDQIHPTIRGQSIMALELARLIYKEKLLASEAAWRWDDLKNYEELSQKLGFDDYFNYYMNISSANYVGSYDERAAEFLEEALKIRPDSVETKSRLAYIYSKLNKKEKFLKLYRELYKNSSGLGKDFFEKHPELVKEILTKEN